MRLINHARVQIFIAVTVLATCLILTSCAANPNSETYTKILTGSANPVGVQEGRLTVIALDSTDGEPLGGAEIIVVSAEATVREPHYYRRVSTTDRTGTVTFSNVPRLVNVSITHPRGSYAQEGYVVPQGAPSEFRVNIDTTSERGRDECTTATRCFN